MHPNLQNFYRGVQVQATIRRHRIFINTLKIQNNQIAADLVQHAPNDAGCCPTEHVVKTFALQNGALELISTAPLPSAQ